METKFLCPKCKKEFTQDAKGKWGYVREFCSRSCANSKNCDSETKEKISKSLTGRPTSKFTIIDYCNCNHCNKLFVFKPIKNEIRKFCGRLCANSFMASKGGRASSLINNKRSKNEILFAELCCNKFKSVRINETIFNGWDADVIIDDIKVAVLWNGKWHYEKITERHSVKQVQNRDRIKMEEITKHGYEYYIVKDMGKHNKDFVISEFNKFLVSRGLMVRSLVS